MKKLLFLLIPLLLLVACGLEDSYWNYGRECTVASKHYDLRDNPYEIGLVQYNPFLRSNIIRYFRVEEAFWKSAKLGDKVMGDSFKILSIGLIDYYKEGNG